MLGGRCLLPSVLKRKERILQHSNNSLIFWPVGGLLARQDTLQRQYPQSHFAYSYLHGTLPFVRETVQTIHTDDDVKQVASRSSEHGWIEVERRNVGRAHRSERRPQLRIAQVLKPEIYILSNDRGTLECRGGKPDHQKANPMAHQRRQQAKLTF